MWPLSGLTSVNVIASILGMFLKSNIDPEIVIQSNIRVIEPKIIGRIFEFSAANIERSNAIARNYFPEKFLFGASSSAYQIEGAYHSPEKGLSVWDYWTHNDEFSVVDGSNGDVACDSFHKFAEDIELVKNIQGNVYRISLSWTRILPDGFSNFISPEGIRYYNELINSMVLANITPMVTIHQYDIPYKLQLLGGWTNPDMVKYFTDFAKVAFTSFGDRVKYWVTIDDPWTLCNMQFGNAYRPYYNDSSIGNYLCGHHVLLAHATTYRMYSEQFQWLQKGKVGLSVGLRWFEPEDYTSEGDSEAAEISYQFTNYWFLQPLLGESGDYPEIMKFNIGVQSNLEFYRFSRLPAFSPEQKEMLKRSLDFVGINFFTTYSVKQNIDADKIPLYNILSTESLSNDMTAYWLPYDDAYGAFEIKNTPENFKKLLLRLNDDYILPQIYITANGYPDFGETFDLDRAVYHNDHIRTLLEAMKDGVDVHGYIAYSLMDSFEWQAGYTKKFGLFSVDFDDANRTRYEKLSTNLIRDIYKSRSLPEDLTNLVNSQAKFVNTGEIYITSVRKFSTKLAFNSSDNG